MPSCQAVADKLAALAQSAAQAAVAVPDKLVAAAGHSPLAAQLAGRRMGRIAADRVDR